MLKTKESKTKKANNMIKLREKEDNFLWIHANTSSHLILSQMNLARGTQIIETLTKIIANISLVPRLQILEARRQVSAHFYDVDF